LFLGSRKGASGRDPLELRSGGSSPRPAHELTNATAIASEIRVIKRTIDPGIAGAYSMPGIVGTE